MPWGGTAHPVWFKSDPRVANVRALGGVMNRQIMQGVIDVTKMVEADIRPLPVDQQDIELGKIAASMQAGMPPREWTRVNTSVDSIHASGPLGRSQVAIHGNSNYKQTAMMQAYAAYSLLQQAPLRTGFASGCQAFGYQNLLGQLKAFGLVQDPIVTRNA